jgi:hypothetical protein
MREHEMPKFFQIIENRKSLKNIPSHQLLKMAVGEG